MYSNKLLVSRGHDMASGWVLVTKKRPGHDFQSLPPTSGEGKETEGYVFSLMVHDVCNYV